MTTIKPLPKQVLVKPAPARPAETAGGIILPNDVPNPQEAIVVAIGADVNPDIKKGQTIIFQKFQGEAIEVDKTAYIILPELAILGIIEEVSNG